VTEISLTRRIPLSWGEYRAGDALALQGVRLPAAERAHVVPRLGDIDAYLSSPDRPGWAWTAMREPDHSPIWCWGAWCYPRHPDAPWIAVMWGLPSETITMRHWVGITAAVGQTIRLLRSSGIERVEADVTGGWPLGERWLERLGFERDRVMVGAVPATREVSSPMHATVFRIEF